MSNLQIASSINFAEVAASEISSWRLKHEITEAITKVTRLEVQNFRRDRLKEFQESRAEAGLLNGPLSDMLAIELEKDIRHSNPIIGSQRILEITDLQLRDCIIGGLAGGPIRTALAWRLATEISDPYIRAWTFLAIAVRLIRQNNSQALQ